MSVPATRLKDFSSYSHRPAVDTPPNTEQRQIDQAIQRLRTGARAFAKLTIAERIALARSMQEGVSRVARRAVEAGCRAKGIPLGSPGEAEEWATGPWGVVRQLRLVRESLQALDKSGNTSIGPISRTIDGRLAARVFPGNAIDGMLFKDVTIDVHMQGEVTEERLASSRARFYQQPDHDGRVVLVLAAGNIAAIAPMDVVTKMFNEGKVCVVKMNPVNAYLGPYLEEAFAEPIKRNFLALVYGGPEEGRYLVYHRDIDEVHITGSDKTHDQIVWGPAGVESEARKERNEPLLKKPITSELGNISPIIVVPGPYTDKELRFQAEDAAAGFTMNGSFLCNAAKMLVLPKGWQGSDTYLAGLKQLCASLPPRQAYYPGAEERWLSLTAGRGGLDRYGSPAPGALPWTFIDNLNPDARNEPLYSQEPFCAVLSEVRLANADPVEFLDRAVDFVNNDLWGTLTATLVVHPKSLKDPRINEAVERAIVKLRYGTVSINGFTGLSFVFAAPPWGAYPGSTLDDIQSGRGFVHNTAMLEGIEKVAMRAPLTAFPKPGYFPTHRTTHKMMPRMVAMEEHASWSKVPGIVMTAMRG